ncbi:hypothetical protein FXO38_33470 [Capsicum annuum]|nr:hypothetical protein FXO38_33470 [Capsicum annuum]
MTAASLGTRLNFDSEYTPSNEYKQPSPVQVRQRSAATRERARRGGGRGGQQRNEVHAEHNLVDEENLSDHGVQYESNFNMSLATTNVEPYYPACDYVGASTSETNFSHDQSSDFVTPSVGDLDNPRRSTRPHVPTVSCFRNFCIREKLHVEDVKNSFAL